MAKCEKCGARKRRWPRSCPGCGSGVHPKDAAGNATDRAVASGLFGWIWRGVVAAVRAVLRVLN